MHICSAYTNRTEDLENSFTSVVFSRSSWQVNQVERQGLETSATPLNYCAVGLCKTWWAQSRTLTQLHGASRKKKIELILDVLIHSLTVGHCIKEKKTYIKAALKQTSGAMTLKSGRQSFWANLSMFPATEVIVFLNVHLYSPAQ